MILLGMNMSDMSDSMKLCIFSFFFSHFLLSAFSRNFLTTVLPKQNVMYAKMNLNEVSYIVCTVYVTIYIYHYKINMLARTFINSEYTQFYARKSPRPIHNVYVQRGCKKWGSCHLTKMLYVFP